MTVDIASAVVTWSELVREMITRDNLVWLKFREIYRAEVVYRLNSTGQVVNRENMEKAFAELALDTIRPVEQLMKVHKCDKCPEYHKAFVKCLIIGTTEITDHVTQMSKTEYHILHNVTLAFPVHGQETVMFILVKNIKQLAMVADPLNDRNIYVDPQYVEIPLTEEVQAH